jgi:hypothetical protein
MLSMLPAARECSRAVNYWSLKHWSTYEQCPRPITADRLSASSPTRPAAASCARQAVQPTCWLLKHLCQPAVELSIEQHPRPSLSTAGSGWLIGRTVSEGPPAPAEELCARPQHMLHHTHSVKFNSVQCQCCRHTPNTQTACLPAAGMPC